MINPNSSSFISLLIISLIWILLCSCLPLFSSSSIFLIFVHSRLFIRSTNCAKQYSTMDANTKMLHQNSVGKFSPLPRGLTLVCMMVPFLIPVRGYGYSEGRTVYLKTIDMWNTNCIYFEVQANFTTKNLIKSDVVNRFLCITLEKIDINKCLLIYIFIAHFMPKIIKINIV